MQKIQNLALPALSQVRGGHRGETELLDADVIRKMSKL